MNIKFTPHKIDVLETFSDENFQYQVSDHFFENNPQNNTRDLAFKNDKLPCFYLHSSVYLEKEKIRQPIYEIPQDSFEIWGEISSVHNVLVLGCAGCTIPRFFVLKYPECCVTGVEISKRLIDIAHKYFFIPEFKNRFSLVCDDAFSFTPQLKNQHFDIIYVDLFDGFSVPNDVFSEEFCNKQFQYMSEDSMLLINLLDVEYEKALLFVKQNKKIFEKACLLMQGSKVFVVFAKTGNGNWSTFKDAIEKKKINTVFL